MSSTNVPSGVSSPAYCAWPTFSCAGVVAGDPLHRRERVLAGDLDLAHVADVEQTGARAHRQMLVGDPGVLDRHVPAGIRHHAGARSAMTCV